MAETNLVTKILRNEESGVQEVANIGVLAENVIITLDDGSTISLAEFFKDYQNFMKSKDVGFIFNNSSGQKEEPTNVNKFNLWIDRSAGNNF